MKMNIFNRFFIKGKRKRLASDIQLIEKAMTESNIWGVNIPTACLLMEKVMEYIDLFDQNVFLNRVNNTTFFTHFSDVDDMVVWLRNVSGTYSDFVRDEADTLQDNPINFVSNPTLRKEISGLVFVNKKNLMNNLTVINILLQELLIRDQLLDKDTRAYLNMRLFHGYEFLLGFIETTLEVMINGDNKTS